MFAILTFLTGLTIPLLPLLPSFFPRVGLRPFRAGHSRMVRLLQMALIWLFALLALGSQPGSWGWVALGLAVWFSFVALRFFPENIFVALTAPRRARQGLADKAPVLAAERNGEVVAYPIELIVPHHIINDAIGGEPALVAW
jgi:hypothetical protein